MAFSDARKERGLYHAEVTATERISPHLVRLTFGSADLASLPRHGFEVLPLDGTFTPMPNGDHLWRTNDHAQTRRELLRHSRLDATAHGSHPATASPTRRAAPRRRATPSTSSRARAWCRRPTIRACCSR